MSVGHICNVVLGGLENFSPELVSTCFFNIKQTISTSSSSLFEIHFCYSVLFHVLYIFNMMMLSNVCIFQVTKFCRVVPEYGVCFMLHFWQQNFEISSRLLENLCTNDLNKE